MITFQTKAFVLGSVLVCGLACTPTVQLSPMQKRMITTKRFECNYENAFRACLTVLQDQGYIIKNTDMDSGLIVANVDRQTSAGSQVAQVLFLGYAFDKGTEVEVSCVVNKLSESSQDIRLNIQEVKYGQSSWLSGTSKNSSKQILEPRIYQSLFNEIVVEVKRREALEGTAADGIAPKPEAQKPAALKSAATKPIVPKPALPQNLNSENPGAPKGNVPNRDTNESPQQVRVIIEKAVVMREPNFRSQVLANLTYGMILNLVSEVDRWDVVHFPSGDKRFLMQGYIHKTAVENVRPGAADTDRYVSTIRMNDGTIIKANIISQGEGELVVDTSLGRLHLKYADIDTIDAPTDQPAPLAAGLVQEYSASHPAVAEPAEGPRSVKPLARSAPPALEELAAPVADNSGRFRAAGLEMFLGLSSGIPDFEVASSYANSWKYRLLDAVNENTSVRGSASKGTQNLPFYGSIVFFPSENIGIEAGLSGQSIAFPLESAFRFSWKWYNSGYSDLGSDWAGSFELRSIPIFMNIVARLGTKDVLGAFISGGLVVSVNEVNANAYIGKAFTYDNLFYQWIDAARLPFAIHEPWTALGFDLGAGINVRFSPNVGLGAEVRYFYCPPRELQWSCEGGYFNGIYFGNISLNLAVSDADSIGNNISKITIDPSFIRFSAGVKFYF